MLSFFCATERLDLTSWVKEIRFASELKGRLVSFSAAYDSDAILGIAKVNTETTIIAANTVPIAFFLVSIFPTTLARVMITPTTMHAKK